MDMITKTSLTYELTEPRRFTQQWERDASLQLREGDEAALQTYRKHGRIIDGGTIEHTEHDAARAWLADTLTGHRSLLIVDTNEQAARLSAQLRAELVRLGRVEENGVPLGLQGHHRRGRGPGPRHGATAGTWPGSTATGAARSTASTTASSRPAPTAA